MATWQLVIVGTLEAASLALVARLWLKYRKLGNGHRLFWSIVLLIPILGIAAYMAWFDASDDELFDDYVAKEVGAIVEHSEENYHE